MCLHSPFFFALLFHTVFDIHKTNMSTTKRARKKYCTLLTFDEWYKVSLGINATTEGEIKTQRKFSI